MITGSCSSTASQANTWRRWHLRVEGREKKSFTNKPLWLDCAESWGSKKLNASRDSLNYPLADFSHTLKNHNRVPEQPGGRPRQRSVLLFLMLTLLLLTFVQGITFFGVSGGGGRADGSLTTTLRSNRGYYHGALFPAALWWLRCSRHWPTKNKKNKTLQALSTPAFSWHDAVMLETGTFCSVMLSHSLRRPPLP